MSSIRPYAPWQEQFGGRTQLHERELFKDQARTVFTELLDELQEDDDGPLTQAQIQARRRLVAQLFQELFDLKNRAITGCVHGSGLTKAKDSEWCHPLKGHDHQLGELRHPVLVDDEGATDAWGWQFRMYFAAPLVEPALIVFLVFARKPIARSATEWEVVKRLQDGHIAQACAEFLSWLEERQIGHELPQGNQ
ncbi:hypothetical protein [Mycobacteroides abscessus]|uniref:Uncharacterized protein n=1 Tax=Mycobacteroides abscessus TaxID=36809 RepID=A0ABD7HI63_9MYCO|nr:hypothetical protein [Mycobacteroides abscessus]RIT32694.1 hypothetical protein D2E76_23055 [Mycobacteroides abscessus]